MLKALSALIVGATILAIHINGANAFWRLLCDGSVGLARIDPLTNIGTVSDHVHSIKGGSGKFTPQCAISSFLPSMLQVLHMRVFLIFYYFQAANVRRDD